MAAPDRRGISLQDAEVSVAGRTLYPTSLSFSRTRNKTVQDVIGSRIVTKLGSGDKTWTMDCILTQEDYEVLILASDDESVFSITGRIPVANGNFKNVLLSGCELDEDSQSLQGDGNSTMTIGGTWQERLYS